MAPESTRDGLDPLLLRRAAALVDQGAASVVREHRLTVDQWRMLELLAVHGPLAMSTLCGELSLAGATATRVADHLVTEDLAHRDIDDIDRRRVVLHASRQGRHLYGQLVEKVEAAQEQELRALADTEPERLARLIDRFPGPSSIPESFSQTSGR